MSEKEKSIMETFEQAIPHLSEKQKSYLLGYGDAVLDMRKRPDEGKPEEQPFQEGV